MTPPSRSTKYPVSIQHRLEQGVRELGLALTDSQQRQLQDYLALLDKWNKTYNLTAIRAPEQMLTHHLLDCLAIVPAVHAALAQIPASESSAGAPTLLDVGSGAGLPGLILAIACPAVQVTVLDAVEKKTAFMAHAITTLNLKNSRAVHDRIEHHRMSPSPNLITSRAYSTLSNFAATVAHLASPATVLLAMKGKRPDDELGSLADGWEAPAVTKLQVPGLSAERTLVTLRRH